MQDPVLKVDGLSVTFRSSLAILDDVSLEVRRGQTLGIVGESGCGKSMTALAIMRLMPSAALKVSGGDIRLNGENLLALDEEAMRAIRGSRAAMIFQDPMTSLNPLFTVGNQVGESIRKNRQIDRAEARQITVDLLKAVGLPDPERHLDYYPHQLSGGKRQRVMIAMAIAGNPDVLIADEPTTALDVTVQAQIFQVLRDMQAASGTAIVLITHDMGAISEMADRVAVMYAGRVVEEGPADEILAAPRHPYTRGLVSCIPRVSDEAFDGWPELPVIPGTVPDLDKRGAGCHFAPRCPLADDRCAARRPPVLQDGERRCACWYGMAGGPAA